MWGWATQRKGCRDVVDVGVMFAGEDVVDGIVVDREMWLMGKLWLVGELWL